MKTIIILLVSLIVASCSNPASAPIIDSVAPKVITGSFDCERPLPLIVNIEPNKYCFCLLSVKQTIQGDDREGTWKTVSGISADFENGKLIFEYSVPCSEYRILLW